MHLVSYPSNCCHCSFSVLHAVVLRLYFPLEGFNFSCIHISGGQYLFYFYLFLISLCGKQDIITNPLARALQNTSIMWNICFRKLYIADARPKKNALANGAMGGGSESSSNYFHSEVSQFY